MDDDGPAVKLYDALVRLLHAVEDLHEGAFAGTVLADKGMHLAPLHLEVDAVVGKHQGEPLGDALHVDGECHGRHYMRPPAARIIVALGEA